jgi:hypothetical protein
MEKKYQLGGSVDPIAVEEIIDPLAPQDEEQLQQVEQFKGALRKGAEELRQRNTFQFHTERPKGFGDSQYDLEATQPHHIENFEEMRGQRQGIGGKFAAAIAKLSLGTAGHVVGGLAGVGYGAFELAKGAVQGDPDMKDFTNNKVFMFLDEYTEALQENFPHYYTQAEREKGLIDTLGTMNFWGDKMVNGFSFLASAAITEVFAVGLGNIAGGAAMGVANAARFTRLSNMLSRSATGAKALSSLKGSNLLATAGETLTLTRQLATGAGYESALEARDAYNRVLDTLLENDEFATRFESAAELKGEALTREEKIKLLSDTEKEAVDRKATDLHNAVFAGNMFLVGTSNMVMLGNLYGPGRASRAGAQALPSETILTKVAKKWDTLKNAAVRDRIRTGGKFAGRMAYEGLVEEGGQNAMGKAAEDYALHSILEDDEFVNAQGDFMDSVAEGVGDTLFTQEGKEQMLIGALLGGMGIPTRRGVTMGGMFAFGDSAEVKARRALLDLDLKGKDKSRMESLIKEKMENDPEFLNRFKKKNYMAYQLYKRTQARNAAQESGDLKAQKDVEADDMFDYLMYRYDNGDMSVIAEEMEDMLKTDPETFKATFGYASEMSIEDVQARQSELKQTVKDAIKRVEKASSIVDSRLKLSEQQKFTDIAVPGSQAHLRRVLIHSATMIEDRDKREKQLIAKLAELSGGKVQETSGEVDAIVFNTPEGPVTVKVGGLNLGATVQEQLEESELRISEIQGLAPNRRSVEQENELKNLTLLRDKLLKETDKDRSLYSVTLEDMSSDEKKDLSEWEKLDPVNSALNREEVENTLRDLRKLRADRLFFARTFNRFMDPDTRAGAIERITALREAYIKDHMKKQGESEARIEEFKLKLEQYKEDLAAEYTALQEKIEAAQTEMELALKDMISKERALFMATGRTKRLSTALAKSEQAYKESQARFEELVLSTSGTREDIKELTRFIKMFLSDTSDPQLLDPKLKAQFEEAWDKVIASGTVSERSELGTPESDAFRAGIYGILQMNENAFEALTEAENDIRERLEELNALNDLARGILAQETTDVSTSVLEDQIALNDAQITKLEAELEIILAQKEGERTKEEIYQNTLKNYMVIRLYETFRQTIARELDPLRTPTEETKVTDNTLDIEQEQADGVSPVDKTEEEKAYRLPDISDPGFFRSTGEHDSALKTFNELSKKQKKTPEDLKNLAIAEHQLAWFEWLHNSSKDNSTDPFVRMMIVHSKMVPADMQELTAYTGADKKTAPVSLFYGETEDAQLDDIKLVAVKLIYDKGNYVGYKPVRENGRLVFSSMLRSTLQMQNADGSVRERFSNKMNLSEKEQWKKANDHEALRTSIKEWTSPKLVRITGKSMGSLELDSTQMEFAEDTIELDPKKLQNVPLFVAAPEQTTKQTELKSVRIQLPGTPNLPKVMGRTGTVWAYDQSRGMLVPMNRTLLSENEAKNVSKMFHLLLKKSKEEVESGTSLKDSKKRAEEFKVRTSGYAIPLWEQISDIVYTLASQGSNYTLTTRLIGKELAVVYGPANEVVKLSDFESNSQKAQDFITFLRTKYHQVNAKTLSKNGKPSVVREKYEKDGKKYDKNTFIAAEGAEWVKVELNENLEPIEDSKNIFKNYNAYLLSKNKDGYAPLKTMSKAVKKVSLTSRRARGGYVVIQNDPSKYMPVGGVETTTVQAPPAETPATFVPVPENERTEIDALLEMAQGILSPSVEDLAGAPSISLADVQLPEDAVEVSADQVKGMSALIAARKAGLPVPEATVPPVNLPEDLNQSSTSEDEESPFMGVLAADSPFVNTRMESISEEMVRATGMTPLEIALTDVLLTSKDGHAVAQLTDFGKVLLSTLAPAGAIYHEAFHNISLYILSTNDSKRIYDAVRRVPGTSITYQGIEKSMSSFSNKEAEEWLADTFRKWILSEGSHKIEADKDDRSMIQRFFDTLKGLIKRLFNVNDVFEYDPSRSSIEHLFTDIKDGKFLQSVRDSSRGSHSTYDMGAFDDTGFSATLKKDMIDSYTGFIGYLVGRPIKLGKESEEHTMELQDIYRAMSSKDPEVLKKLRDVHGMAIVIARRYLAKREAELADTDSPEKIAVQNAIQLFGRNGKEGDPEMIRALQLEYMKKLGFTADKEDGYEDDDTSSRSKEWDKNAADDSPSGTASGILKMLVGTLQDPSSKNSLGLPGIYNGAEVLKMLQNDTANSTTYAQVIAKMESLVGAPGRPWMAEVLRRVKSVSDSSIFEDMLLRSEMSRQFRKHAQDPWQLNATAEGRMNSFDAAGLATEAKIRTAWQANLAAIANDKRFTHVSFTPSGKVLFDVKKEFTLSNGRKVSLSNLVPAISDMKDWDTLLDTAELFGIEFSSRGALKQAEDSQELFEQVQKDLRGIVGAITEAAVPIANLFNRLTDENTGAVTRANNMIRLELRSGIIARERSFLGQENRPQYSLVDPSAITFVANSSPNQLPHLDPKTNRYTQGALTWKVVSETPDSPMGIQVRSVLGLNTDAFDDDGTKLTKAELNDLLTVHIGALMDGVTVIPRAADKTLEIGVHLPIWDKMAGWGYTKQGKFSAETVMPLMLDYLRAEIEASVMGQKDLAHIDKYTDNIKELRMFKFKKLRKTPDVPSEHEILTKQFLENELKSGQAYAQIKAEGKSTIINDFIEANKGLFESIIRESIVSDRENLKVLMEEVGLLVPAKKGAHTVYGLGKTAQLLDTLELNEVIEDLVLRHSIGKQEVFKMFLGDPAFYSDLFKRVGGAVSAKILADTSEDLMVLANKYGDLHRTDGFLDMITISEPIAQMPENILAEYARFVEKGVLKSYEQNIDLADGALFVDMPTYRMLGLLTQQWEMDKETAYDALKNGKRTQLPKGTFPSEKYQFDGWAQSLGIPLKTFLKMSVIPVDETFATINGETFPNIGLILKFMRDNKVGGIVLPSGQKYGKPTKPNRAGFKYAENGLIEFDAAPITSKMSYDLRFWGSQLKVAPNFKGNTSKATQAQTHTMSDMYMDGVLAVGGEVAAAKLKRYNDLINLQVKNRFNKMLTKLSITKVEKSGENFYNLSKESYEKVLEMLESEGINREVGEGLLQGLKYYKKKNDTSFKFEYLVDAKRMEGSFYSIMAKSVIKHKLKGEMLTLVPSFGYEVVRGKGGIIEDRKLGFYENPDGKWTMDVYMPHQFKQFLGQDLHVVDGQIYDPITGIIMEGSAKLLEMIGIRIPTDGNHSVDLINIKGFLPYEAGPKIIVPPGLLIKSGTDFDIDKMTTYFQSHKLVNGKLVPTPSAETIEEYFMEQMEESESKLIPEEKIEAMKTSAQRIKALSHNMAEKFDTTYQKYHNQEGRISFEEWLTWPENQDLDLETLRPEGAIQNEMMDIMRDLLGMKERAEDLLRPVNITDMQHFADEIYRKAAEAYDIPNLGDVSDYHEATSLHNILRVTQAYWQGKDAVGITAVASTHHVKSQIAGLKLNMETPVQRNTLGVIEPKLYFTGFENSPNEISLGRLYGNVDSRESELKISNVLSQNVNAAVDTVNRPVLHILNMGPQMLPAAIFLIRAGVPLESVTYFLNQPIVREYMKQRVKGSGKLLRVAVKPKNSSKGKSEIELEEEEVAHLFFGIKTQKRENPATYEKEHIAAALEVFKQPTALSFQNTKKTYFDPETLKKMMGMSPTSMSEEERNAQGQILRDLFVYMTIGEDLSTLAIVQAFDTKPPKGRIHSRVMMKKYNDLLERNVFINAEKITDSASSFLYEMKNYNEEAPKVVRELFVAEQLDEVYNEAFEFRLNELTHPNRRMGIDDVVKDLVRLEQGFISAILQRVASIDSGAVADHAQRLLYGKNSMARQLLSIQEDESHPLNQNFWIRNMIPVVQENPDEAGLNDHIELWNKTMTSLDLAVLNEAFKEIVAYDGLRGTTIAKDLLRTAILQSGTINSPFSFLETLDGEMVAKTFEEIIGTYLNDPSTLGIPSTEKRPASLRFLMALDNNYKSRRPYAGIKSKNKKKYIPLTVQKTKEGVWVLEYNIEVNGKIVSENATMPFTDSPSYLNLSPRQALSTDRNAEYENNDQSDIICP